MNGMGIPERFATERFELVLLGPRDRDRIHALWTEPAVRRFLWDGEVIPQTRTDEIIAENAKLFRAGGFGIWGAWEGASLIAFTGFWHFRDPPDLEFLFGVSSGHCMRGVATEIGDAVIGRARRDLGWGVIWASTDRENVASISALEKLGFSLDREERIEGLDTLFFRHRES